MEIVGYGVLLAIGWYLAPIIVMLVLSIISLPKEYIMPIAAVIITFITVCMCGYIIGYSISMIR